MSYGYGKLHTFFGTAAALCRLAWKIRKRQVQEWWAQS